MGIRSWFFVLPFILGLGLHITCSLRICAFNIKTFGDAKMSNETIADIIVNIVTMYDIALIQEVRDKDLSAVNLLLSKINRISLSPYSYVVSDPLGRNTYKEQYLFIFRTEAVAVTGDYHYDDGCEPCGTDTFNREPYVVRFACLNSAVPDFVIIPQHAAPNEAVKEIDALVDVILDVESKWNTNDILLIGDFNAGCSYVTEREWPNIRLRTDARYQWLIPDTADTTVTRTTDCPYDRIVATGSNLTNSIVPESSIVFNFQDVFNLSYEMALAVSDHFPVEISLH
ncbi:deoxyribonuclease-1-like [Protopterus annectens]|uniref:deoxyribonuclease-1-like n=1 Tax=Protopterus annectens TaxID=7888 RepID=UPI001CF9A22C|nr:deoxyribonuclease-1-like [Protopterus annectens]